MKMYLAGLGWMTDAPAGNRLRWSYPVQALKSSKTYLGLPETIIVERAWLDEMLPEPQEHGNLSLINTPRVPSSWWQSFGDVHPDGFLVQKFRLKKGAQAVQFTFRGANSRLRVFADSTLLTERMISDGDVFNWEAPLINGFHINGASATFQNMMVLDLFADRGLTWAQLATVRVADTVNIDLDSAHLRYDKPVSLTHSQWAEFVEAAQRGQASTPGTPTDGNPTDWEAFSILMGLRWEHAVLFGHGFHDGPRKNWPETDEYVRDKFLTGIPATAVAYRVRAGQQKELISNIVVCPPQPVSPLTPPGQPIYSDAKVQLSVDPDTDKPFFLASYGLKWTQADPIALGVEILEQTSASATAGTSLTSEQFESRTRLPEDTLNEGAVIRSRPVPFHDVQIQCKARAIDGWDRVSANTPWTPWTSLPLIHNPAAPSLTAAHYNGGMVRLTRQLGEPGLPDWRPDLGIRHDPSAKLDIYRRTTQPRYENGSTTAPSLVDGQRYQCTVSGVVNLHEFEHGYLIVRPFKGQISHISGSTVFFTVPESMMTLFSAGPCELQQNPLDLAQWTKAAEFSPLALPDELSFSDPVVGPHGEADILSYHTRLSFLGGRIGPAGNTVQAIRIPPTPAVPPPFSVERLGVDFYNRTMVKIRFSTPVSSGLYTVWWADGALTPAQFESQAVPGERRAQLPYENYMLFDVLAIPLPQTLARDITVGIQQVNDGEGQSAFKTVQVNLLAMTP